MSKDLLTARQAREISDLRKEVSSPELGLVCEGIKQAAHKGFNNVLIGNEYAYLITDLKDLGYKIKGSAKTNFIRIKW